MIFRIEFFLTSLLIVTYAALLTAYLPRRANFGLRASAAAAVIAMALVAFNVAFTCWGWGGYAYTLTACLLAMVGIKVCYRERMIQIFFWCMIGMAAEGMAEAVARALCFYFPLAHRHMGFTFLVCNLLLGGLSFWVMVYQPNRGGGKRPKMNQVFLFIVVLLVAVFGMMDSYEWLRGDRGLYLVAMALLSVLGMALLYVYQVQYIAKDHYQKLKEMLDENRIRYEVSKEYADLINMKCHDMKHQLHRMQGTAKLDDQYLRELEQVIDMYDSDYQTGNEALDIILTEKARICSGEGIEATFVADGKAVSFMEPTDVYSLFGNILDNAIEAVRRLPDEEMRQVSMVIAEDAGVIHIRQQNYFDGQAVFDDEGELRTTKSDDRYHGFGLKSIRFVTGKYGGAAQMETRGNVFLVNIVFPVGADRS